MKVNRTIPSKVLSLYGENKKSIQSKKVGEVKSKDSIQISSVGKSLSSYSIEDKFINSKEKLEKLKEAIKNGTYNRDSKVIAKKIIDCIKKRED
ncbi:flagellar biosynthesis anti-sigma factor FlgM [Clostridium rectalis]|uniref:flagellar biosynthesis anti-sigma factor FlgM n=1 Tax=Clostridium rectalis TaxID=2040295 RepID=UPI000F63C1CA|nr:flagellar biosynthesis anti-sigma factor FlgM [Clostridium rectalis]